MNVEKRYFEMADETLQEAILMKQNLHFRAAVSRAYYASYYAVQAVLTSINISAKTHQGTLTMFSKHFPATQTLC